MHQIELKNARILTISQSEKDCQKIKTFMARMPFDFLTAQDFKVGELAPTDDYDFAIFDATSLPKIVSDKMELSETDAQHLALFRELLSKPIKYVIYYGEFLHDLDRERCPSANSKFTLFARIRELIDFINHYKNP